MGQGFHTITLGCKLNQFDGAAIDAELTDRGLTRLGEVRGASVVVINTCTVTARADAEARKLVRRVRRENPDCRLIVTGCYAEARPEQLRAMAGVDHVFGNRDKHDLSAVLDGLGLGDRRASAQPAGDRGCDGPLSLPRAVHFGERSRAFLKIQEGCNLACSYCVIPQVRGPSRSVPPAEVERALVKLVAAGYREVVLTGVNTGDYGKDLQPRTRLARLLERLLRACGPARIRLNSLEPRTVTDEIVQLLADHDALAPHLQVPLQSGSDEVLAHMRRNYRRELYLERLARLRDAVPDIGLGADVIVGFPGERDDHFEETYRLITGSPLNYLHVFSWSPRRGTPASELNGRVSGATVRDRSARLRSLGQRLGYRFRRRFVGRRLDAVALGPARRSGTLRALTGNFIEVELPDGAARRGSRLAVEIVRVELSRTVARAAGNRGRDSVGAGSR